MDFETLAGIYVYAADNHSGMGSRLYRLMSRIDMRLGDSAWRAIRDISADPYGDWDRARDAYATLTARGAR